MPPKHTLDWCDSTTGERCQTGIRTATRMFPYAYPSLDTAAALSASLCKVSHKGSIRRITGRLHSPPESPAELNTCFVVIGIVEYRQTELRSPVVRHARPPKLGSSSGTSDI